MFSALFHTSPHPALSNSFTNEPQSPYWYWWSPRWTHASTFAALIDAAVRPDADVGRCVPVGVGVADAAEDDVTT